MSSKTLVAIIQLTCTNDRDNNFTIAHDLISKAASLGCRMAFLPECLDMICSNRKEAMELMEPVDGHLISRYRSVASDMKMWLFLGGYHERVDGHEKAKNSHVVINSDGHIVDVYHKIHLFNLHIPGVIRLMESGFYDGGQDLLPPTRTPFGSVGLGICYDSRFPEMAISLAQSGADILTYGSAYTITTGMDHWFTLLKSRAIDTQCYVIGAAQTGVHNQARSSYGHAMIVDPFGSVVAQCSEGINMAIGVIDQNVLSYARKSVPIWSDRRPDVYGRVLSPPVRMDIICSDTYIFGEKTITHDMVFTRTRLTFGFMSIEGELIICPLRSPVKRMTGLSPEELTDLFEVTKQIVSKVESVTDTTGCTILLNNGHDGHDGHDGPVTPTCFHVHIIPAETLMKQINRSMVQSLRGS